MPRISFIFVGLLIGSFSTVSAVQAASLCGVKTHQTFGETRAYIDHALATLRQDGSGHLVLYHMDESAPLGWSHSLRLFKKDKQADWQIEVVDVDAYALKEKGYTFAVDEGGRSPFTISLAEDQLPNTMSTNEWTLALTDDERRATLRAFGRGNFVEWRYSRPSGEIERVVFSLKGIRKGTAWVECGLG